MLVKTKTTLLGKPYMLVTSDEDRYVVVDDIEYSIFCIDADREAENECTEGDIIPTDENAEQADKAEAYDILMGVTP